MSIIYLVEDDHALAIQIQKSLERWGYQTCLTKNFQCLDQEVNACQPDLILLDVMMPGYDGWTVGGDDFLQKPFSLELLIAKVQAILRRSQVHCDFYQYKELKLEELSLYYHEKELVLSPNEAKILKCLLKTAPKILKREELMDLLWKSEDFVDENTLSVNVSRLRKKMEEWEIPYHIETIRGMGYRLL